MRALTIADQGEWSEGRRFEIDLDSGVLAEAVRRELRRQLSDPATWQAAVEAVMSQRGPVLLRMMAATETSPGNNNAQGAAADASHEGEQRLAEAAQRVTFPNPSAFRISGSNGVVFDDPQPSAIGGIPGQGGGARFMWYPGKRALRAGQVSDTQWDDINIGDYSIAMGFFTTAESMGETVIGSFDTDYIPLGTGGWAATDCLFVIGNGLDSNSRSDAMVVLKNGNTGIGIATPTVPLQVDNGSDCGLGGGGYLVTSTTGSTNLCIDNNEVPARFNGGPATLFLNNDVNSTTWVGGSLRVSALAAGTATHLCIDGGVLASCTSSGRYKEAIEPLSLGLDVVQALQPVSFKWKDSEERDLGFVAEAVAAIDPLLATYDRDGTILGVKYPQLTAVLVNAIQQQQLQLREQQRRIAMLEEERQQIAGLRAEPTRQQQSLATGLQQLQAALTERSAGNRQPAAFVAAMPIP